MTSLFCILTVLIATSPLTAVALNKNENPNATIQQELFNIQSKALNRKSFTIDFEQTSFSALRNRTNTQKGTLKFLAPQSFKWEITTPNRELYISNGISFWKYSEAAKHAQKLSADVAELKFLQILFKPYIWNNDYNISSWSVPKATDAKTTDDWEIPPKQENKTLNVTLIPKKKSRQKKILAVLDTTNGFISQLRIFFENGNKSKILFSTLTEKNFNAADFDFIPPLGIAIDDETGKKP